MSTGEKNPDTGTPSRLKTNILRVLCEKISTCRQKYGNSNISILLIPIFCAVCVFFILSRLGFFKNIENTRYMLSALVQSEAAIIAIVISINLVGIQLGAAYSPRVARIFGDSFQSRVLISSYVIAISHGLWVLGMIESGFEFHIRMSYSLGIFCFVFLFLYTIETLKIIEPSKNIEKLSQKINKGNILNREEVIQPITDIIRRSILNSDEETARIGLKTIGDRIREILTNEVFDLIEEKSFMPKIYPHLVGTGEFIMCRGSDSALVAVVMALENIGTRAVEKRLKVTVGYASMYISELANKADFISSNFNNTVANARISLFSIAMAAINNDFPTEAIISIAEYLLKLKRTKVWLLALHDEAMKKGNDELASYLQVVCKQAGENT